jgi:3-hydroxyisobutyrate dehydrogenase
MNMSTVAFIGLGAMGARIAQNLINAGYPIVVYNRTEAKAKVLVDQGTLFAASPREAAAKADVIISMVTDNEASRHIWLDPEVGAIAALNAQKIAIEASTLTVGWTRELASKITMQGAGFLDAPVVGSRPQAEVGKLITLVGGRSETFATALPVLQAAGAAIVHHVGGVGQGMMMKLAVNALFGIQVSALAETLGLLAKDGITPETAMACLGDLPVTSLAAKVAGGLMVAQNYAPSFPIALVEKDFRYALETAQVLNTTMPTAKAVQQVFQAAINQGYGQNNITGVAQLYV